jgi:hypothetical protein
VRSLQPNIIDQLRPPRPGSGRACDRNTCQTPAVETLRLRRARFVGVLLTTALGLGVIYGLLIAWLGQAAFLLTWWGTFLRGLAAVLICFAIAGYVDRRWSAR